MKSVIGLEFCSGGAWGLFVFAQLMCVACALGSVYRNRKVQLDPNMSEIQEKNEDEMTEERSKQINNNDIKSESNDKNVVEETEKKSAQKDFIDVLR